MTRIINILFVLLLLPPHGFTQTTLTATMGGGDTLTATLGGRDALTATLGAAKEETELTDYVSQMAFWGNEFNFTANIWEDKSGNDNHLLLKNASARTGDGVNLDYTITGLLTTDAVTVEAGSDTPTIPVNGTLRIGATDTIYGVTIKRAGATWAVIPFCEPKIDINIPLVSYDVSGNGNHATCAGLVDANVVTQDSCFYLAEYGYSAKGDDILNWDLTESNWTGSIDDFDAKWAELNYYNPQSADWNMQPTPDGNGARIHITAAGVMGFRDYDVLTVGRQYRVLCETENYSGSIEYSSGISVTTLELTRVNENWIYGDGSHDIISPAATNVHFFVGESNNVTSVDIDIKSMSCHEYIIVPALLDGTADALGNEIEYEQTGTRWLRWAHDIALEETNHNISVDLKGRWSDIMFSGLCDADQVYLIKETEADYFGSGKVVHDTFQSDGTEVLARDNKVRQLLENNGNTGFFFQDDSTQNEISFDSMYSIQPHFMYCDLGKTKNERYKWTLDDRNYTEDLVIIDSGIFINDPLTFNAFFDPEERVDYGIITFVWDALGDDNLDTMLTIMEDHNIYSTLAIFYSDMHYDSIVKWVANEQDCEVHTPADYRKTFPYTGLFSYRGFHDDATNYTVAQLQDYYQDIFSPWATQYNSQFGNITHKIFPGGAHDDVTDAVVLDYFDAGYLAGNNILQNNLPLWNIKRLIRQSVDDISDPWLPLYKSYIDEAIKDKSWIIYYAHPKSFPGWDYGNFIELIEYIEGKIDDGDMIRIMPMEEAWEVIMREI